MQKERLKDIVYRVWLLVDAECVFNEWKKKKEEVLLI